MRIPISALCSLPLLFASGAASPSGTLSGKATFTGKAPRPQKVEPTADIAFCSQQRLVDESLLVDGKSRGIKNVVVWIEGSKAPPADKPRAIENTHCRYEPHVVALPAGQELLIVNRDHFMHTSLAKSEKGKQIFNVALPNKDKEIKKTFPSPGVYALSCEVHDWMQGWVVATGGEISAVTDDKGIFTVTGVPAGKQKVHFWHESLGAQVVEVDVADKGSVEVAATWAAPRK